MAINLLHYDYVVVAEKPVPVGTQVEFPSRTVEVEECFPCPSGGYYICINTAMIYATDIEGKRLP